ncbi:MAG: hypothetical protein ACI8T1_001057 [Verrucomicrobiales bacterium]|jgi:hypothetical protein
MALLPMIRRKLEGGDRAAPAVPNNADPIFPGANASETRRLRQFDIQRCCGFFRKCEDCPSENLAVGRQWSQDASCFGRILRSIRLADYPDLYAE